MSRSLGKHEIKEFPEDCFHDVGTQQVSGCGGH